MNSADWKKALKRLNWPTVALVAQAVWSVCFVIAIVALVVLIAQEHGKPGKDVADEVAGLKAGLFSLIPVAAIALASTLGLWKVRRWGWWFAFLLDSFLFLLLAYAIFDEDIETPDPSMFTVALAALLPVALLLLPSVRAKYLGIVKRPALQPIQRTATVRELKETRAEATSVPKPTPDVPSAPEPELMTPVSPPIEETAPLENGAPRIETVSADVPIARPAPKPRSPRKPRARKNPAEISVPTESSEKPAATNGLEKHDAPAGDKPDTPKPDVQ